MCLQRDEDDTEKCREDAGDTKKCREDARYTKYADDAERCTDIVERGVTPRETHRDVEGAERHRGTKRRTEIQRCRETERDLEKTYSREM